MLATFLALPGCAWCVVKVPFNFDAASLRGLKGAEAAEPRLLSLSKMVKCLLLRAASVHAPPPQARVPKRPAAAEAAAEAAAAAAAEAAAAAAEAEAAAARRLHRRASRGLGALHAALVEDLERVRALVLAANAQLRDRVVVMNGTI